MYQVTVGLEIHAELKTHTKMFCGCLNDPDEKIPNKNICPVCMGHPGTLPVINKEAVHKVLQVGTALGSTLANYSEFDRKNYFYPDIPKGYQISQYKFPLVSGGELSDVALTRIHLEEDTARSQHEGEKSLVDFNRAGVPLTELVTEPVIHTPHEAGTFARELQLLLRYLGVGEANMEKGEMRVEANISVSKDSILGTKVEVKNLNSIRSMERAIEYEVKRQSAALDRGEVVVQETRGWDENKQATFSQRKKEGSADYRYFPDPDLPKLKISGIPEFSFEVLKKEISGNLPWDKRERLKSLGFLQIQDIEQLVGDSDLAKLFDETEAKLTNSELLKIAANLILNDIAGKRKKEPTWLPTTEHLVDVVKKYHEGALASPQAKSSILSGTISHTTEAETLPALAQEVIDLNSSAVREYKAGKQVALQFLVGQGMRLSRGSANPEALRTALLKILG